MSQNQFAMYVTAGSYALFMKTGSIINKTIGSESFWNFDHKRTPCCESILISDQIKSEVLYKDKKMQVRRTMALNFD